MDALRKSFNKNPVLYIAGALGAVLYVLNGVKTGDWTVDTLQGFITGALGVAATLIARASVYAPATVDEFAAATDDSALQE